MRRLLFVAVFTFSVLEISAQQDPQFTQNMFNRLSVNPGYAGSTGDICGTLLIREQWTGFEGNPKTNLFSADGTFNVNLNKTYKFGAGLTIIQDEIGPIQSLNAKGALSYHHRISQGVLSAGLEFGIFNQSLNADWRTTLGDGTEDPKIPNSEAGATAFDLGLGLYYYRKDMYVGLSSTHLNQPEITDEPDEISSLTFQQVRHYYVMAGYNYPLTVGNADLELQPSIFVKTDAVSTQVDINTNVLYNNLVWAGVSYRVQDAVSFLTGIRLGGLETFKGKALGNIKVGFAYDYNISDLSNYNNGSLEVMINYCHKIIKNTRIERYKDVRFL